jgi:membrane protease YdiL (CAAX protease family)
VKRDKRFILFNLSEKDYSYRGVACLFFAFLGTLLIAAMLSGPIYVICSKINNPLSQYIVTKGICKIYDRIVLITSVICLPFFLKKCRVKNLISTDSKSNSLKLFLAWMCLGALFMDIVTAFEVILTDKSIIFDQRALKLFSVKFPWFVSCAIIVGILEETLFRGAILRMFYTAFTPITAILFSSMFFAYLHTKIPLAASVSNFNVGAWSGFRCLFPMMCGFIYKFNIFQFIKLVLFGTILSMITIKTRSLIPSIGFHSGVVLLLFSFNFFA